MSEVKFEYYPDGSNDFKNGQEIEYYPSGSIRFIRNYENGIMNCQMFDNEKRLVSETFSDGTYKRYHPNGIIKTERKILKHLGKFEFYNEYNENGTLIDIQEKFKNSYRYKLKI